MHIRAFEVGDTERVVALWHKTGLTRPWNDPYKDIERKLTVQPELFLVGELNDEITATAMGGYDGHRGSVYYLAVSPRHTAQGYGRAIMRALEARLVAMGCPKLNLLFRSDNAAVQGFYQHAGYETQQVNCLGKRLIED